MVPSDSRTPRRITSLNRIDEMTTLFYFCAKLRSSFGRSLAVAIIPGHSDVVWFVGCVLLWVFTGLDLQH